MTMVSHRLAKKVLALAGCLACLGLRVEPCRAYDLSPGASWPWGRIEMAVDLGASGGALLDGKPSWNAVALEALQTWNTVPPTVKFAGALRPAPATSVRDNVNSIVWSSPAQDPSVQDVLAVTHKWWIGSRIKEADVLVNADTEWNSYRDSLYNHIDPATHQFVIDLERVLLHELGHVLGLGHEDSIPTLMNSQISDITTIGPDERAGIAVLYPPESTPPTATLTEPGAGAAPTSPQIHLAGIARDNCLVDRVLVQLNDGPWLPTSALTPAAACAWQANVERPQQLYSIRVQAFDTSGNASQVTGRSYYPKATYEGLFAAASGNPLTGSGSVSLRLTPAGKYSGQLRFAGVNVPVSGSFNPSGHSTNTVSPRGQPPVQVDLQLQPGMESVAGTLDNGVWSATLLAKKAAFSVRANPCPFAGKYSLVVPGEVGAGIRPAGHGFASLAVTVAGKIRVAGSLPDGATFTQGSSVATDGSWPSFAALYRGQGLFQGWISLDSGGAPTNGLITWIKPSSSSNGFATPGFATTAFAVVSPFQAPAGGATGLTWTDGELILSGGTLQNPSVVPLTLGSGGRIVTGSTGLALSLSSATGLFRGSFLASDGSRATIKGILLQSENAGFGFFLSPTQNGAVNLQQR